jgi:IPT/TIG domain
MAIKGFSVSNLLSILLMALPLSARINFVQQNNTTSNPSGLSMRVAFRAVQGAGNLNIVVVGWNDTCAAVKSITDAHGNIYALAIGPTAGTALTESIYYAKNIAGGGNTVTVTFNQSAAFADVRVLEYAGLDPTNPLDVTSAAVGNSRNGSSGPAATTGFNELIFGAGMTFDVFSAAGSGFTNRVITEFGDIAEDATVLSAGTYGVTAPLRASAPWVMQMAAFRGSGQVPKRMPTVSAISPLTGTVAGGTPVTITGTGFLMGATVSLGGTAATGATVVNGTSIRATTRASAAGVVDVVVTNPDNQRSTLSRGYTYASSTTSGGVSTPGGISFVQVKAGVATSGSSLAVAYPAAQTAGNLNVIAVMWGDTTSSVNSVTDSRGNPYALAVGPTRTNGLSSSIYYAKNIAAGGNTVTVTFNQRAGWPNVNVLEYSGLDTANPLDVVATASGNGTIANSGVANTTSANELIVGAGNPTSLFKAAGSGFSSRLINSFGGISEDAIVTNVGNYRATAVMTSGTWVMQMATFRTPQTPSGTPTPPTPPPTPPGDARTYTTNFPLAESSISEGGNWIGAGTTGLDWTDMQTTPGFAFATQTGNNPALFDDSIAVLAGTWANNQSAQGTVQIVTPLTVIPGPCYQESEIFLRASISPHSVTGYEVNVGAWNTLSSYIHVVRWNGSFGNFTTILSATGSQYGVKTGDIVSARIAGNVITVFINGVQKGQVTDSTYTSGSPGMGMYIQNPSACGSGNSNFGFSSYTATEN